VFGNSVFPEEQAMGQPQKLAWFSLIVVAMTFAAVCTLYPFLGRAAVFGFGLSGFVDLGWRLFYRSHRGEVVVDERDKAILLRSTIFAYSTFFIIFTASPLFALAIYGFDGAVPIPVVMYALWSAALVVLGLQAIATLVQYRKGGVDAGS
jgi:hypothetical protein